MKVRGVQAIEITIDESQVKKITLEKLRKLYDLPEGSFIKGNMICYEHEVHTSHSWWETVEYRKGPE